MKKDGSTLLIILFCSLTFVLGIFLGRNLNAEYVILEENTQATEINHEQNRDIYRVDINTAAKAQLQELPGIGEVLAERIIDYRETNGPFQTIDDLCNVEGIAEKKLNAIKELIKVG